VDRAISMKPACEIDEYASILFTFRWTSAAKLPTTSDATAMPANAHDQRCSSCGNAVRNSRNASANAATFVAADMNAVTVVGAPSYTSGVHMWNGAEDDLKPRPAMIIASPSTRTASPARFWAPTAPAISSNPMRFVAPYTSAEPNRSEAEPNEPTIRYFRP